MHHELEVVLFGGIGGVVIMLLWEIRERLDTVVRVLQEIASRR